MVRENTLDEYIEKEVKSYLKHITLNKNDIWLDAGCNIGFFSNLISNKVKNVIGYEPEDDNYNLAIINNKKNKNVFLIKKAIVGNKDLKRSFFINNKKNKGSHSFLVKRGRTEIEVDTININDVINTWQINKIKMDIEGGEYEVLKNMDFNKIEEMVIEYHFIALKDKNNSKYFEIINILKNNFSIVKYIEDRKQNWTTLISCKK